MYQSINNNRLAETKLSVKQSEKRLASSIALKRIQKWIENNNFNYPPRDLIQYLTEKNAYNYIEIRKPKSMKLKLKKNTKLLICYLNFGTKHEYESSVTTLK